MELFIREESNVKKKLFFSWKLVYFKNRVLKFVCFWLVDFFVKWSCFLAVVSFEDVSGYIGFCLVIL